MLVALRASLAATTLLLCPALGLAQLQFEVLDQHGNRQQQQVPVVDGCATVPLPEEGLARLLPDLHRMVGGVDFEVRFQLEESVSEWRMTWMGAGETARERPGFALAVQFEPVYGARWLFRVAHPQAGRLLIVEQELKGLPEPDDLHYRLRVRLPADGGIRVSFVDGPSIVATQLGGLLSGQLSFYAKGGVASCELQPPRSSAATPEALAMAWRGVPREPARLPLAMAYASLRESLEQPPATLEQLRHRTRERWHRDLNTVADLVSVRQVDRVEAGPLIYDRVVLETLPRLELPVVIIRSRTTTEPRPGVLLLATTATNPKHELEGKTHPRVLSLARSLAIEGAVVAILEPLGVGERRHFQAHDGRGDLHLILSGSHPEGLLVHEARQVLAYLSALAEVDGERLAVVGMHGNSDVATGLALCEESLAAVIIELDPAEFLDTSGELAEIQQRWQGRPGQAFDAAQGWRRTPVDRWRALGSRLRLSLEPDAEHPGMSMDFLGTADPDEFQISASPLDEICLKSLQLMETGRHPNDPGSPDIASPLPPQSLIFGDLEVASMWDSWFQAQAFARADEATPHKMPGSTPERVAAALQIDPAMATAARVVASLSAGDEGRIALLETQRGTRISCLLFPETPHANPPSPSAAGSLAQAPANSPRLLPPDCRYLTVAVGDYGALDALEEARRHLPAREGEWWCGVNLGGSDPGRSMVALDRVARQLGQISAAWMVSDLRDVLLRIRQDPDQALQVRLFGVGAHGVFAALYATLHHENLVELSTLRCIPEFRSLLEIEPRHRDPDLPNDLLSVHPHPSLFIPGVLQSFEIEDLVLHLTEHGVAVHWIEASDALGQPRSRAKELARWPRMQHRQRSRTEDGR